jgi:hypothetical protein
MPRYSITFDFDVHNESELLRYARSFAKASGEFTPTTTQEALVQVLVHAQNPLGGFEDSPWTVTDTRCERHLPKIEQGLRVRFKVAYGDYPLPPVPAGTVGVVTQVYDGRPIVRLLGDDPRIEAVRCALDGEYHGAIVIETGGDEDDDPTSYFYFWSVVEEA